MSENENPKWHQVWIKPCVVIHHLLKISENHPKVLSFLGPPDDRNHFHTGSAVWEVHTDCRTLAADPHTARQPSRTVKSMPKRVSVITLLATNIPHPMYVSKMISFSQGGISYFPGGYIHITKCLIFWHHLRLKPASLQSWLQDWFGLPLLRFRASEGWTNLWDHSSYQYGFWC